MTPEETEAHLEHCKTVQWYKDTMRTWWGYPKNTVYLIDETSFKEIEGISEFHVVEGDVECTH